MNAEAKKTILIIDDHPIVKEGLGQMLDSQPDLAVCGTADTLGTTLQKLNQLKPDLVLLDINLPGPNGLEVLKNIKSHSPRTPVLMLSMHHENLYALRALRAGAAGYIMKSESPDQLLTAIREVLKGEVYLSPDLEKQVTRQCLGQGGGPSSPLESLSDRELEVLTLLGNGHGTRAIADKLGLSVKTVESHRAHIKEKLNLNDATELVRYATQLESMEFGTNSAEAAAEGETVDPAPLPAEKE